MRMNDRSIKQGDKLLKMHGKFDRGPIEFKSHIVQQEGEIMAIATRNVVSIPQTTSIMGAVDTMTKCGFRRLPVTDPGTKKLRGIITAGDVINFMGGGEKYHLVQVKHGGNLIAAVNESVREIMTQKVETLHDTAKISDAVSIIVKKKIGGLPIVDKDGALVAIATERDAMRVLAAERSDLLVEDIMTDKTSSDSSRKSNFICHPRHDSTQVQTTSSCKRRSHVWNYHCYGHYAISWQPRSLFPTLNWKCRRGNGPASSHSTLRRSFHHCT